MRLYRKEAKVSSLKKLFEDDISRSLAALVRYYYKPPDGITNANKVDFLAVYQGLFVAIEAKEVNGATYNPKGDLTPAQLMTLRDVTAGGGLGILAVNFYRRRQVGSTRGWCGLWLIKPESVIDRFKYREWEVEARPGPEGSWLLAKPLDKLRSRHVWSESAGTSETA